MPKRFEGHFRAADQTELFYQTWVPDRARGVFVITHGLAEHSDCYHPLARVLVDDGWHVFAWDLRGHGRSEGNRGYVAHINQYMDDLEVFHRQVVRSENSLNLILFGHSMGGLITLRTLQTRTLAHSALALSSPALGLTVQVPKFKEALARVAVKWLPKITMHNEIRYEDLSRDEVMRASYACDTLRQDKISPGLFLSMVEGFDLAASAAEQIQCPVLMQIAGQDRVVRSDAAREFFDKLSNKRSQLLVYPESYHEIYNDLDRDTAIADLKKFTNTFLGAAE